jgi:DNA polymerase-3 subunit epsilon
MRFAITDIETVGSKPGQGTIIEIAICIHDGEKVIDKYETLINPEKKIPPFIVSLTGINDKMLLHAPLFEDVADEIFDLLKDCVFVAHNVNFDYNFVKAELDAAGFQWKPEKLCTVRLARASFPGHRKYGLSSMCELFEIPNFAAHRAMGDAQATSILFDKCIEEHGFTIIHDMLKLGSGDSFLPNHIPNEEFQQLPTTAGIYFFKNEKGEHLYIGKALNIKKRVRSHFNPDGGERQQFFLREIAHIEFQETGTELLASLMEDAAIRKHFPKYNKAQKKKAHPFHLISFFDQKGIHRLQVIKGKTAQSIHSFPSMKAAYQWLNALKDEHHIQGRWIGLHNFQGEELQDEISVHNQALENALQTMIAKQPSYLVIGRGRKDNEKSFVWVQRGNLKGYAFVDRDQRIEHEEELDWIIQPLPSSEITPYLLKSHFESPKQCYIKTFSDPLLECDKL